MKLTDIPSEAVIVIACRVATLPSVFCANSTTSPCVNCEEPVWLTSESAERLAAGAYLFCVPCAKELAKIEPLEFQNSSVVPATIEFFGVGDQNPSLN